MGNRVDVSSNRKCAQLERLADRRAAPHERIEHDPVSNPSAFVEQAHHVCSTRSERAEYDGPEGRAEAMRPPLVDVVQGAIDLLAPTFDLADIAKSLKRERLVLDGAAAVRQHNGTDRLLRVGAQCWGEMSIASGHVRPFELLPQHLRLGSVYPCTHSVRYRSAIRVVKNWPLDRAAIIPWYRNSGTSK